MLRIDCDCIYATFFGRRAHMRTEQFGRATHGKAEGSYMRGLCPLPPPRQRLPLHFRPRHILSGGVHIDQEMCVMDASKEGVRLCKPAFTRSQVILNRKP